jgi:hypothetical protein
MWPVLGASIRVSSQLLAQRSTLARLGEANALVVADSHRAAGNPVAYSLHSGYLRLFASESTLHP